MAHVNVGRELRLAQIRKIAEGIRGRAGEAAYKKAREELADIVPDLPRSVMFDREAIEQLMILAWLRGWSSSREGYS